MRITHIFIVVDQYCDNIVKSFCDRNILISKVDRSVKKFKELLIPAVSRKYPKTALFVILLDTEEKSRGYWGV